MRCIIVDDSLLGIKTVKAILKKYSPYVEVVGSAQSSQEAYALFVAEKPDLVLLDIEMPGGNGFSFLEMVQPLGIPFQVIFITAFNQYAIKAIKFCALDYILKPVDAHELAASIAKAKDNMTDVRFLERYQNLIDNRQASDKDHQKLAIPTSQGYLFLPIKTILRCEGDGNYIRIFTREGKVILATKRLKEVEDLLGQHRFLRIHRSHLVNLDYVVQYHRGEGGIVQMTDGTEINVARSRKDILLSMLKAS